MRLRIAAALVVGCTAITVPGGGELNGSNSSVGSDTGCVRLCRTSQAPGDWGLFCEVSDRYLRPAHGLTVTVFWPPPCPSGTPIACRMRRSSRRCSGRGSREKHQCEYFEALAQEVAKRAKMDDDTMAEIRAKVRAAHEGETESSEE